MFIAIIIYVLLITSKTKPCKPRKYSYDSIVCVCDKSYCDTITLTIPPIRSYVKYTSTRSGLRFEENIGSFQKDDNIDAGFLIEINSLVQYKNIIGFGGAFTDSAGFNIHSLSKDVGDKILSSFYSNEGIEYTVGRVPMGATDFSTGPYTYDDVDGDVDLKQFKLKNEDYLYKIPYIKKAMALSNNTLRLIATPWTAPPWMKTNNNYAYIGQLKPEYYQTFANYYIKFLESYYANGITFWSVTTGNEPWNGFYPFPMPTMGWTVENSIKWLSENLGPTIKKSNFNQTKIFILDDQKILVPLVQEFFNNDKALKYVDGVAYHWYMNSRSPPNFLNFAKTPKKDLMLMPTEAATGFLKLTAVKLGDWERAEDYIDDILLSLQYDANGWMDNNLALDLKGGHVYTYFPADACIIVNATADEFYKQPMFYAMGHFSKFLPRNSVRVQTKYVGQSHVMGMAFKRPDRGIVLILYNKNESDQNVAVKDGNREIITINVEKQSVNTILYW